MLNIQTLRELEKELGINEIYLEYYLPNNVAIYSADNYKYRIIKYNQSEKESRIEVYKTVDEVVEKEEISN